MSPNDQQLALATNWVTGLARELATSSKVGVISIQWKRQDNLFILEIEGNGGKRVSKLFDPSELALYPLEGRNLVFFEAQLTRLIRYFKKR